MIVIILFITPAKTPNTIAKTNNLNQLKTPTKVPTIPSSTFHFRTILSLYNLPNIYIFALNYLLFIRNYIIILLV